MGGVPDNDVWRLIGVADVTNRFAPRNDGGWCHMIMTEHSERPTILFVMIAALEEGLPQLERSRVDSLR